MIPAALDWAAMTIAAALVAEDEPAPQNGPRPTGWCGHDARLEDRAF
jgi:hypothetical protein